MFQNLNMTLSVVLTFKVKSQLSYSLPMFCVNDDNKYVINKKGAKLEFPITIKASGSTVSFKA